MLCGIDRGLFIAREMGGIRRGRSVDQDAVPGREPESGPELARGLGQPAQGQLEGADPQARRGRVGDLVGDEPVAVRPHLEGEVPGGADVAGPPFPVGPGGAVDQRLGQPVAL